MSTPVPLADLLIIGGITIDRFGDGGIAPGGSVLHAARATSRAGLRVIAITVAGPEPVAAAGLAELADLAAVHVTDADTTIIYRHRDSQDGRRLWLEAKTGEVRLADDARERLPTGAILFAPVNGEVPAAVLDTWGDAWTRGAMLQGWLRRGALGDEVEPVAPSELDDDLVARLSALDMLIASREDLIAAATEPHAQITVLRDRVGPGPALVVTDGIDGVWIDSGHRAPRHLPAPWRVVDVPTVGAGDAFAALFVARLAGAGPPDALRFRDARRDLDEAATFAMRGVAEMLEARRS